MDQEIVPVNTEVVFPMLVMPKKCTTLESNGKSENIFIELKITSPDTEGNETCIYSGICNIKIVDTNNNATDIGVASRDTIDGQYYNQSQVWIDPARSPYVYNKLDVTESQGKYVCETHTNQITVNHHNTYITQNVYNTKESVNYCTVDEYNQKKFEKVQQTEMVQNDATYYEMDEFECGVFLSQLPEEIIHENENRAREEMKFVESVNDNSALKQLMSSDIQSMSKQRKTILFLGDDSQYGQTIQKIAVNDPSLECTSGVEIDHEVVIEDTMNHKRYQCDKCKQIFDQISTFKEHMVVNHKPTSIKEYPIQKSSRYTCNECGKNIKNKIKFEHHCLKHGDPDLECNKCHKVFASKFTLRTHRKIHYRKHPCKYCTRSYSDPDSLRAHILKFHFVCDFCDYVAGTLQEFDAHKRSHEMNYRASDVEESEDEVSDIIINSPESTKFKMESMDMEHSDINEPDSVLAKVVSNKIFLLKSQKTKKQRILNKVCDVCCKTFDRVGDLKRHLIQHVIRCTLAKNPVSADGTLNIVCEVCLTETFTKIDRYKAHLREHAKLTIYKCTFCDKSFSDSSNFSKHKKIHGATFFQCDLCHRKFNSKKMIAQHMEYHNNNSPIPCKHCDKVFHFESMLNKHIKCTHTREVNTRFRCRFCHEYFRALKEKWDHEWMVHNVRSMIVDCLICGSKFRKYSELKRHCIDEHEMEIPPAKKLLRKKWYQ